MQNSLLVDAFSFSFPSYELQHKLIPLQKAYFYLRWSLTPMKSSMWGRYLDNKTRTMTLEKLLFWLLCCGLFFLILKKIHLTKKHISVFLHRQLCSHFIQTLQSHQNNTRSSDRNNFACSQRWEILPFSFKLLHHWAFELRSQTFLKVALSTASAPDVPSLPSHPPVCPAAPQEQEKSCPLSRPGIDSDLPTPVPVCQRFRPSTAT